MKFAAPVLPARAVRIGQELCAALAAIDSAQLRAWAIAAAARIGPLLAQRGRSLAGFGKALAQGLGQEASAAWSALSPREGAGQLWHRWRGAGRHQGRGDHGAGHIPLDWLHRLVREPRATAIELAMSLAARAIAAGDRGAQGDVDLGPLSGGGAVPATRSIFTGIVLEALLLAFSDLAHAVHGHLPAQRDPAWDALEARRAHLADLAGRGHAGDIAWHLFVEAFVQPQTRHGGIVPEMPLTLHQELMAADTADGAQGEGADEHDSVITGETPEQRENDMMRRWIGIAAEA